MKRSFMRIRLIPAVLAAALVTGLCFINSTALCLAADSDEKVDLSAISGFTNTYTVDKDGKFEIEGAMVTGGSVYNITVDGEAIQAWSSNYKSRTWEKKQLKKLLNDPTTFFYERVSGTPDKAEFSNKVEFERPNGVNQ